VKSTSASPGSAIPGTILLEAVYTVEELMLRLGWSTATLEAAHCRGLRIRHLGGSGYVIGTDVADFLRSMPKPLAEADGDGTPAPCTPDVSPGFAEEAWAKAQGCCEVCNGPAYTVTRSPETSRPVVLCRHHFEQRGGA
jgi:hypothetical protein